MKNVTRRKTLLLLTAAALLLTVTVGGTVAYLFTSTGAVENTFEPAKVVPVIEEDFTDESVKKDVLIRNDGNVDAYIRATYVVNWQKVEKVDDEENVLLKEIDAGQYVITFADDAAQKWTEQGGYYYYNGVVKPGGATSVLIKECKLAEGVTPPDGYTLHVEILAQAIQAEGMGASGAADAFSKAADAFSKAADGN